MPKYSEVFCSQCGESQGPGDHGFSHCEDHKAPEVVETSGDSYMSDYYSYWTSRGHSGD